MIFQKKLIRDLWSNKTPNLAISILIAIGIGIFFSFGLLKYNLELSVEDFYKKGNLSPAYVDLKSMPYQRIKYLEEIEGVDKAEGRLELELKTDFEGGGEDVYIKLQSYEEENIYNRFLLENGRYPKMGSREIVLDGEFAKNNDIELGDEIKVYKDGESMALEVVGIGNSPEFIYLIKSPTDIMPDYSKYGTGTVPLDVMNMFSEEDSSYNRVFFSLDKGEDFGVVKENIQTKIKDGGISNIYEKDDLVSYKLMDQNIYTVTMMSVILPVLFVSIASLIEFIVIERLVQSQRSQIGILKAFGYYNKDVFYYYVKYCIVLGIVGVILGILSGIPLLNRMVGMYTDYYNLPEIKKDITPFYLIASLAFATIFSAIAGINGSREVLTLKPVDAMKPKLEGYSQKKPLPKTLLGMFTTTGRMSLRNTTRNKKRSLFILVGVMFTFALSSLTFIVTYIIDDMVFDRYNFVEKYDGKINLKYPIDSDKATEEIMRNYDIEHGEAILQAPVTLYNQNRYKDVTITGTDNDLYSIVNENNEKINLRKGDVIITKRLAKELDISAGDRVYIKSKMAKEDDYIPITISSIIDQYIGMGLYMDREALSDLLEQKNIATSIIFKANNDTIDQIEKDYMDSPLVSSVDKVNKIKDNVRENLGSFEYLTNVFAFLGALMGFVVIYNSYLVSIAERQRELTSMLVLGFSRREVSQVVSLEQWLLSVIAMIMGIPISKGILIFLSWGISSDAMTLPTKLKPIGFIIGGICTCLSIIVAQRVGFNKIKKFSIVEVLKERE